jgi:hypothetical protein
MCSLGEAILCVKRSLKHNVRSLLGSVLFCSSVNGWTASHKWM